MEQAKEMIGMGFRLGIGGVVTFKNSTLREVLRDIALENIVVETDSPYLAPTPYRGKRNETSYITEVVKQLSYVYEVSEQEIKNRTTENALALFKL